MNPFGNNGYQQPGAGSGPNTMMNNPFGQGPQRAGMGPATGGAYSYDVQTTYMPETSVPAVPQAGPGMMPTSGFPPPSYAATGTVPAVPMSTPAGVPPGTPPQQKSGFRMPFMNSTALPSATGNIGSAPGAGPAGGIQPVPAGQPMRDTQPLLQPERPKEDASKYAFYNVRRYRPYFDVDTTEVLWRVGSSFIGAFRANFMQVTQERPDLYGPFWVATTLIFVTAVAGNYANYLEWRLEQNQPSPSPPPPLPSPPADASAPPADASGQSGAEFVQQQWFTDYTKLGASAGIFYGYTFVLSLLLWLVMRYMRSDMRLVNMFCVYGYAMTIFIPISLVCIIPQDLVRWLTVMGGTLTSGLFLLMNLKERIMPAGAGKAVPMLLLVLALHVGLGLVLKLYFFHY